ncbi:salivary protein Tsal2A-like [Epargyreus clarus]|uniref:salivary protein Tsal2A-like n=1 Tax=Epargyreus clarus TaxID=520877 RepID=UPI003C2C8704
MFHKLFMLILCVLNIRPGDRCRLNTRIHFGEPLPVILKQGRLLEPNDGYGNVDLNNGESLTLSCEGGGVISHPNAIQQHTTATITCEGGDNFQNHEWLNAPARFSFFRCSYAPNHMSERTNRTCFEGNPIIEVGYRIQNEFYPLFESCFNEATFNAIYSKYTQKAYNALYQTKVDRPFFIDNNNYLQVPVEYLFSPRGQKAAVAQLVGPLIETYFTKTDFLSRGHLAAKTDFVFAFGERATFHYVNCAPQWTGFNGGNWNTLEVDLRNHIHVAGYDTVIYTGTFGVTQLTNQFGRKVDIYLYTDENNNPIIPVPQYFYKVVYEPSSGRGIAFVGINNPHYTPAEARDLFFCVDVCRKSNNFRWLSWHPDNPSEGYTFCCTVPDFRDTVQHLPHFEVRGILT